MIPTVDTTKLSAQCRAKFFGFAEESDIVVTTDRRHIGYLTGYHGITHDGTAPYSQAAVATRTGVALVTGASDAAAALEVMGDVNAIWRYGSFFVGSYKATSGYGQMPAAAETFEEAVLHCLRSVSGEKPSIALDVTDHGLEVALRTQLAGAVYLDARRALISARAIKLGAEIELLRYASHITDEAIASAIPAIAPGITELEIAGLIQGHIVRRGGVPRFTVVTSGERSSRVDAYASSRVIRSGDTVRLDIGCTVNGYSADMARSVVAGLPNQEQESRYQALLAGEQAQLDLLRPGILARDVYRIAMQTVRATGTLPEFQRNHCGHGIGLSSHEFPTLDAMSEAVIEPGMVLCVETPYYEIGWGGMMVEDTALVTENGFELLTKSSRDLVPPHLR